MHVCFAGDALFVASSDIMLCVCVCVCVCVQLYQSLEREQQKHVSHQDTLQQCQTWLSAVQQEVQLHALPPHGLQEALKQVRVTSPPLQYSGNIEV